MSIDHERTASTRRSAWGFDPAEPEAWRSEASCAQSDPEAFFPEKGGATKDAKRICQNCAVIEACLKYALDHDERFGVWGGKSERERRKIRRHQRRSAA